MIYTKQTAISDIDGRVLQAHWAEQTNGWRNAEQFRLNPPPPAPSSFCASRAAASHPVAWTNLVRRRQPYRRGTWCDETRIDYTRRICHCHVVSVRSLQCNARLLTLTLQLMLLSKHRLFCRVEDAGCTSMKWWKQVGQLIACPGRFSGEALIRTTTTTAAAAMSVLVCVRRDWLSS